MSKRPSLLGALPLQTDAASQPAEPVVAVQTGRKPRPNIVHTSVYLPKSVYMKIREIAYFEERKIHDLLMEGVDAVLQKHGKPSVSELKQEPGSAQPSSQG